MLNLRTNFHPTSDQVYVAILFTSKLLIHAGSQHVSASITVYRASKPFIVWRAMGGKVRHREAKLAEKPFLLVDIR